jgi:phosphoheptose isomerase
MRISSEILKSALVTATKTLQSIVDLASQITRASDLIANCPTSGKKILACRNGGSASKAASKPSV